MPCLARDSGIIANRHMCSVVIKRAAVDTEMTLLSKAPELLELLTGYNSLSLGGVQPKSVVDSVYYKYDAFESVYSGLIEHLISRALNYVFINGSPVQHVLYTVCVKDGRRGCWSTEYKRMGEQEISLDLVLQGFELSDLLSCGSVRHLLRTIAVWFFM